ncbi:Putative LOC100575639, partial [Caligus rogercresseyi]
SEDGLPTIVKNFGFRFDIHTRTSKNIQADAVLTINDWFDCMNGHIVNDKNLLKCGFGRHFHDQEQALNKMKKMIQEMKIKGVTRLLPWQKGVLKSIESTFALHEDMKKLGINYIMTSRLNQDHLENFFSRIRALGGDNYHPSPSEFIQRFRILLIGKNNDVLDFDCSSAGFLTQKFVSHMDHQLEDSESTFQRENSLDIDTFD